MRVIDLQRFRSQRNAGLPLEPPVVNNYRVKDSEGAEEAPSEEEFEEVRTVTCRAICVLCCSL